MVKAYVYTRNQHSPDEIIMEENYRRQDMDVWEEGAEWVVIKGRDESGIYPASEVIKIWFMDED